MTSLLVIVHVIPEGTKDVLCTQLVGLRVAIEMYCPMICTFQEATWQATEPQVRRK